MTQKAMQWKAELGWGREGSPGPRTVRVMGCDHKAEAGGGVRRKGPPAKECGHLQKLRNTRDLSLSWSLQKDCPADSLTIASDTDLGLLTSQNPRKYLCVPSNPERLYERRGLERKAPAAPCPPHRRPPGRPGWGWAASAGWRCSTFTKTPSPPPALRGLPSNGGKAAPPHRTYLVLPPLLSRTDSQPRNPTSKDRHPLIHPDTPPRLGQRLLTASPAHC